MDEDRIAAIEQKLSDHIESEREYRAEVKETLKSINQRVDALCGYFEQGRGMIRLLSWVAGVGGAIAAVYTFVKDLVVISMK